MRGSALLVFFAILEARAGPTEARLALLVGHLWVGTRPWLFGTGENLCTHLAGSMRCLRIAAKQVSSWQVPPWWRGGSMFYTYWRHVSMWTIGQQLNEQNCQNGLVETPPCLDIVKWFMSNKTPKCYQPDGSGWMCNRYLTTFGFYPRFWNHLDFQGLLWFSREE